MKGCKNQELDSYTRRIWKEIKENHKAAHSKEILGIQEKVQDQSVKSKENYSQEKNIPVEILKEINENPNMEISTDVNDAIESLLTKYSEKIDKTEKDIEKEYQNYQIDFRAYPHILDEIKIFNQLNVLAEVDESGVSDFHEYWIKRILKLRQLEVDTAVKRIRTEWKELVDKIEPFSIKMMPSEKEREGTEERHFNINNIQMKHREIPK